VGQSLSDPGERITAVEIVRGQIEAYRRRDTALAISFFDPYAVWDASRIGGLDAGNVAYGTDAMNDIVGRYRSAFEDYAFEVQRLADLGSGAVLAVVTETGFGKTSGAPVKRHFAVIYTVIERKIVRMSVFPTEKAALEAVGVAENS
jgi:ketosteroid isomerase-like protein